MNPPSMLRLRKLKMQPNAVELNWSTVVAMDSTSSTAVKSLLNGNVPKDQRLV